MTPQKADGKKRIMNELVMLNRKGELNKTEDIVTKALDLSEQKSQADRKRMVGEVEKILETNESLPKGFYVVEWGELKPLLEGKERKS